jgi:hypothetical protein
MPHPHADLNTEAQGGPGHCPHGPTAGKYYRWDLNLTSQLCSSHCPLLSIRNFSTHGLRLSGMLRLVSRGSNSGSQHPAWVLMQAPWENSMGCG